jgi:hypothetical protein
MIPASRVALLSSIQVNDRVNVALLGAEWVEHDEVAAEAPRSGLSRSDFVPWPDSEATADGRDGGSLGNTRRRVDAAGRQWLRPPDAGQQLVSSTSGPPIQSPRRRGRAKPWRHIWPSHGRGRKKSPAKRCRAKHMKI